ncbi:MAG: folate-binding protein YgfZ [Acidimicrobiia bacterium]
MSDEVPMSDERPAMSGHVPFQARIERDVILAEGVDAAGFLQGQLSQDVVGLADGAGAHSLLLQPQGKIDAWLRVTRLGPERFLLDVDGGHGAAVIARLERFKLRTRCQLTTLADWACWAVRGLDGAEVAPVDGEVRAAVGWPGTTGFDRLGPAAALAPLPGVELADTDRYAMARIEAGVPAMGAELGPDTIPAEAGQWLIDVSVSFTKGCYTGQELVARVDSRGSNTPRKLRRLRAAGQGLSAGAALQLDGDDVGEVTSAVAGSAVALGYLKRAVPVPATVRCGGLSVSVEELPGG